MSYSLLILTAEEVNVNSCDISYNRIFNGKMLELLKGKEQDFIYEIKPNEHSDAAAFFPKTRGKDKEFFIGLLTNDLIKINEKSVLKKVVFLISSSKVENELETVDISFRHLIELILTQKVEQHKNYKITHSFLDYQKQK